MIYFNYETDFQLADEARSLAWIQRIISSEGKSEGEISYIFCDDDYLLEINQQYLSHDEYTDIISFDYTVGNQLNGDIFISVERVRENAAEFNTAFDQELLRVMAHGILHYCGYKDKEEQDVLLMRSKEDEKVAWY